MGAACHYCGREYGDPDAGVPDEHALRRHLIAECAEVPAAVRRQYDRSCASGRCGF